MNLISVSSFEDNYIWILVNDNGYCLIIDPGEALPVVKIVKKNGWKPKAIFLTHYHDDHVAGVLELRSLFPNIRVYGSKEVKKKITHIVHDNSIIDLFDRKFFVFSTPGHTLEHLCFFSSPYLFCGDTLFSGGCGKIFEGTFDQMYQSLQKISQLPDDTLICCGHEYTLTNMQFAVSMLPNDSDIKNYFLKVDKLRKNRKKTLPVLLKNEKRINLYLRINDLNFVKKISKNKLENSEEAFRWLRSLKDNFSDSNPF